MQVELETQGRATGIPDSGDARVECRLRVLGSFEDAQGHRRQCQFLKRLDVYEEVDMAVYEAGDNRLAGDINDFRVRRVDLWTTNVSDAAIVVDNDAGVPKRVASRSIDEKTARDYFHS